MPYNRWILHPNVWLRSRYPVSTRETFRADKLQAYSSGAAALTFSWHRMDSGQYPMSGVLCTYSPASN
jgi:hypothetical protein